MLKFNGLLINVSLLAFFPLMLLLFSFEVANGETLGGLFKIYNEIRISPQDMNCDYYLEDYGKHYTNFEYPKLIVIEDQNPIVAFVDVRSEKLIFAEVANAEIKIGNNFHSFGNYSWARWPVIFVKENKIYLAIEVETQADKKGQHQIRVFLLDKKNNQLNLQKDKSFTIKDKRVFLSGIYPYRDRFIVVGGFSDVYFGFGWITGHPPTFNKNFSFVLDDSDVYERQTIEEEGRFGARHREYAVSDSGIMHAAWVRDTVRTGLSKHDEMVCYGENRDGKAWTKPLKLYSVEGTEEFDQIRNLSMASHGNGAFMLWQDTVKGFFFAETKKGQYELVQLSDMKRPQANPRYLEPLSGASTAKIAVDQHGNVYTLWMLNSERGYQIFLKSRIEGKWSKEIVINSGLGTVKLPDMEVDKKGVIHITYIKQKPKEDKFACYYIKMERN